MAKLKDKRITVGSHEFGFGHACQKNERRWPIGRESSEKGLSRCKHYGVVIVGVSKVMALSEVTQGGWGECSQTKSGLEAKL